MPSFGRQRGCAVRLYAFIHPNDRAHLNDDFFVMITHSGGRALRAKKSAIDEINPVRMVVIIITFILYYEYTRDYFYMRVSSISLVRTAVFCRPCTIVARYRSYLKKTKRYSFASNNCALTISSFNLIL